MKLGPYTVVATLRPDNPAFPRYLIFRGEKLVGKQFSMPNESDCRWHEAQKEVKAREERERKSWNTGMFTRRRGRPKKYSDIPVLTELQTLPAT